MSNTPQQFGVAGQRVTVVGAARSGVAAAELLARKGAHVVLSESRAALADEDAARLTAAGVALELGGHVEGTFTGAHLVVTSPGVPPELPVLVAAKAAGVPVIGEVELAFRWLKGRVIAITGTKGKSTTTTLTGRMLAKAGLRVTVGGNIGAPISAQVDGSTPDTLHVIEVSSFQLEQIERFRPWIAVMLNFSPDHLDRHHTVEAYAGAKARVFENQEADDIALVNADDEPAMRLAASTRARRWLFSRHGSLEQGTVIEDGWIVLRQGGRSERLVPLSAIRLLGAHLVDDVMAAATIASSQARGSAAAGPPATSSPHDTGARTSRARAASATAAATAAAPLPGTPITAMWGRGMEMLSSNSASVHAACGWTASGAISTHGSSTKRRVVMRGCGTVSEAVSSTASP